MFNSEPGEYVLFDEQRAYVLFWRRLRSHFYAIVLAKVDRTSVFDSDYMTLEHELFSTVVYDVEGKAAESATQELLTALVSKAVDIDNPIDFVFEMGGTVLNRTPMAISGYPQSDLQ